MPISFVYVYEVILTKLIVGIEAQKNVNFLDFENDFGGWNISFGNWSRSTKNSSINLWSSKSF